MGKKENNVRIFFMKISNQTWNTNSENAAKHNPFGRASKASGKSKKLLEPNNGLHKLLEDSLNFLTNKEENRENFRLHVSKKNVFGGCVTAQKKSIALRNVYGNCLLKYVSKFTTFG